MSNKANSFLHYVAQDIIQKYGTDLSQIAVVFPNKRASLFLNEELARLVDHPLWSPTYITISDLFRKHSELQVGDPIKLICDLHKSFIECTGIDETLDHFYGWGQLLIADFDDVDKNMADTKQLFANLTDLHELDDISYLTDEQKEMIKKFFSNFTDDHDSVLKKRFLQLWCHFHDIYTNFNQRLHKQGLAYEGALYRQVVENKDLQFKYQKYLFVGFNMMQKVETRLCLRLQEEGKAAFYWDYDDYYMTEGNEAGHYIRQYLEYFPNELAHLPHAEIYDNLRKEKDITFISATTDHIQTRYVHQWLMEQERFKAGRRTAVVLADESLLPSVIHALPKEVESVNITLGYPLQSTPFYSLVQQLISLQTVGHKTGSDYYRMRQVYQVLRHPYAVFISEKTNELAERINSEKIFFPDRNWLHNAGNEDTDTIFADLEASANYTLELTNYLLSLLKLIGTHARENNDPLFQESLYRTYTLINRLHSLITDGDLTVDKITLERLIMQLMQSTSIPFHGEPAEGIQIMGVLETRNIDFEHVLVLSAGEGKLPKGVDDSSFIPYSLRKAYGLTTIDNKVAIYAYYFHSILQRATDVTLTYNNATAEGHTGEMSRFMFQLMVESSHNIKRRSLAALQHPLPPDTEGVEKTQEMMDNLMEIKMLTPTFINTFVRCPKRFYYKYVEELKEPEEMEEEIDNRIFGNIFHRAAQLYYLSFAHPEDLRVTKSAELSETGRDEVELIRPLIITKDMVDYGLKNKQFLMRLINQAFCELLFHLKPGQEMPQLNGLQYINREVIFSYLQQLLRLDSDLAPFTILGLEKQVSKTLTVQTTTGEREFLLGGFIDRLDEVSASGKGNVDSQSQRIRVIDYKTGTKSTVYPESVAQYFNSDNVSKHSDYCLQTMLYSLIVSHDGKINPAQEPVSPCLLFIQKAGGKDYNPAINVTINSKRVSIDDATVYEEEYMEQLQNILSSIFNINEPFSATEDKGRCSTCPFAAMCQ